MSIESLDDILGADDIAVKEVDTSEWWGDVSYVQAFDAEAFGIFVGLSNGGEKTTFDAEGVAAVVALTLCKPDGTLLIKRKDWKAAAKKLQAKRFEALQACYMTALELSGLTKGAEDEAAKK